MSEHTGPCSTPSRDTDRTQHESTRTDVVVTWIGWHLGELLAVGVPLVLALSVSLWFLGLAVLIGATWAVHEVRLAREQRALRAAAERRRLTSASSTDEQHEPVSNGEEASA
ncbi:hypothetical protein [Saccharomonospora halophila]|uniref:hypothetical protein n=1 Tax=Saccharomonospora halophila TaxID=129922 RepID=UPI000380818F|nr:hypothetical protein [Saccharomonospora halophila]